jgi:serine/threonine protein kinase
MSEETIMRSAGSTLSEGAVVDGRYILESRLGGGGMGVVYRARDRLMEEQHDPDPFVALKLIAQSIRDYPEAPMALQRECKRAQKLSHRNIVRVFYFGRDGDTYYLTMELLDGRSFERLIGDSPSGIDWTTAAPLVRQLCSALSYAHAEGIVHSDIKPSNVFITAAGVLKILDFGIAAPLRKAESGAAETRFNPRHMGAVSPLYSSLEMHMGRDADPRDDVYSAACVIYELLTGKHPYAGETTIRALELKIEPGPVASLSQSQNKALIRALALRRDERTASIAELQTGLLDKPEAKPASTSSWPKHAAWLGIGVALVALAMTVLWRHSSKHSVDVLRPDAEHTVSKAAAEKLLRFLGIDAPQVTKSGPFTRSILVNILKSAPRLARLGSTPEQIDAAFALCKQYATGCERDWFSDESSREVAIGPFKLDFEPVSVRDFRQFVASLHYVTGAEITGMAYTAVDGRLTPVKGGNWKNAVGSSTPDEDTAVVGVNYRDAETYCTKQGKRLPTEDEWEYTARGPEGQVYPWGNDVGPAAAHSDAQPRVTDGPPEGIGGEYRGLSGGIWEWVDTDVNGRKVLKGGSWREGNPANKRAATRGYELAERANGSTGFRCAKSVTEWPDAEHWLNRIGGS